MNKIKFGLTLTIIGIVLSVIGLVISFTTHAAEPTNDKILVADGKSGQIYVVKSTLKNIDDHTSMRFGQLVMKIDLAYSVYDTSHPMFETTKIAFVTNCLSETNRTILIFGKDGQFDTDKSARGGEDLWLMLVAQRLSLLVCDERYDSVKVIRFETAKELIPQYYSAPN